VPGAKTAYDIYTVTGNTEYTATKDIDVVHFSQMDSTEQPVLKISVGEKLTRSVYLGEGFCQYVVENTQTEIQTDCAQIGDNSDFAKLDLPSHGTEQWIKFDC